MPGYFTPETSYKACGHEIYVMSVDDVTRKMEYINELGVTVVSKYTRAMVPGYGACDMITLGENFIAAYHKEE